MTSNLRVLPVGPVAAQRPLLVAVHGWLLSGRLWQPLIPALGPDWELWAPDLPGFGAQHRPRGLTPNLASYGRWLAGQCEARLTAGRQAVQQLPRLTASLHAPSLWIAGERDTVMAPRYVRHLAGYAPAHGVTVLAGGGHLPMRQMPAELAAVMVPWLNELAPADQATCPQSAASPRSWSSASLA